MSEIKRYHLAEIGWDDGSGDYNDSTIMRESPDGEYVRYSDYEAALAAKDAEIDRLEQKLQAANDEIVTRGIEIERVLRALAAANASLQERCRRLVRHDNVAVAALGGQRGDCDPVDVVCDEFVSRSKEVAQLKQALAAKDAAIERLMAEAQKWRRIRTPAHGDCCTCQACGLDYDSCRCGVDELADELAQLKGLLQEWLAAYLEEFGELDPDLMPDRLDRAYLATKDALAAVRAVQEEKP